MKPPTFTRPRPVDAAFSMGMRGRVRVFDEDHYVAQDSGWSPWQLGTTNWGRILQGLLSEITTGTNVARTLTNVSAVAATYNIKAPTGTAFVSTTSTTNTHARLAYGSSSAAPARANAALATQIARFNASSSASVEVDGKHTITGSAVHTPANDTIREIGLFLLLADSAGALNEVLVDRASVTPASVLTSQTVAVSYEVAY